MGLLRSKLAQLKLKYNQTNPNRKRQATQTALILASLLIIVSFQNCKSNTKGERSSASDTIKSENKKSVSKSPNEESDIGHKNSESDVPSLNPTSNSPSFEMFPCGIGKDHFSKLSCSSYDNLKNTEFINHSVTYGNLKIGTEVRSNGKRYHKFDLSKNTLLNFNQYVVWDFRDAEFVGQDKTLQFYDNFRLINDDYAQGTSFEANANYSCPLKITSQDWQIGKLTTPGFVGVTNPHEYFRLNWRVLPDTRGMAIITSWHKLPKLQTVNFSHVDAYIIFENTSPETNAWFDYGSPIKLGKCNISNPQVPWDKSPSAGANFRSHIREGHLPDIRITCDGNISVIPKIYYVCNYQLPFTEIVR